MNIRYPIYEGVYRILTMITGKPGMRTVIPMKGRVGKNTA